MMGAFVLPLLLATALSANAPGARIYAIACASCHGAEGSGGRNAPSLHGVGSAMLDFELSTGRMPAALPWAQTAHRDARSGQQLDLAAIRALEAYLAPVVAGGPAMPLVTAGNAAHGLEVYRLNCQQCHGVGATGGGLGEQDWVPSLRAATITEVADAVRAGPGQMPRFGPRQLGQDDLDDVAGYVTSLRNRPAAAGPPFRSTGPVPEGAVGYLAILSLIAFVATFWRATRGVN
jgi:ubiquinol-cytochrome c reductase cytochrome c subunit